jgi:hypothetical protein
LQWRSKALTVRDVGEVVEAVGRPESLAPDEQELALSIGSRQLGVRPSQRRADGERCAKTPSLPTNEECCPALLFAVERGVETASRPRSR